MKIVSLITASMLIAAPALVATSAAAATHAKRHRTSRASMKPAPAMKAPDTAATPKQEMNAPASPVGGPVGSGKP